MNKTKLVSTLGPACQDKAILKQLVKNGLNVARFNFSHTDYENSKKNLKVIQEINQELNTYVATMLDTKGPEIRTHEFDGQVQIEKNTQIRIAFKEVLGTKEKFSINYYELYDDIKIDDFIFIDDGYLTLKVIDKDEQNRELVTKAQNSHIVKSRRGVNVPGIKLKIPYISEKDTCDITFACQQKYDFLALSFVRKTQDVLDVKEIVNSCQNKNIKIISKIENQEGMDNLADIIAVSDGIMVARGDLGIEVSGELVPIYQTQMIQDCLNAGKPVIVATQMLESMQKNPRPTKSEISDVWNAVLEGTTATMLSGESASGLYPELAVSYMTKINHKAEEYVDYEFMTSLYEPTNTTDYLAYGVIQMALKGRINIIVVDDLKYAYALSKLHSPVPVLVEVKDQNEGNSLALNFANIPYINQHELITKLKILQKKKLNNLVIATITKDTLTLI
ncbi:pyruvate kinase ['Fragaria x ananassa' phyllody phytoplasma]|uniref:Pyruvate kinase n=1 Tax='Fragaria x ananassa' phyllody phytoplasma TaxID=2358428 RepID=A0ABS5K368_9MOLU|nr:pyruvate kinase ['Fragaria x ananassa' phyllody phytoplasma]MBS2126209.1 pyruvate kinase ['Fragaria x ananassa' phyllody phytoplasma]